MTQKIIPFLWFDDAAEEAMNHYVSIFKNSAIVSLNRFGDNAPPAMKGKVFTGSFQIEGQLFHVINGGPKYHFTEAISLFVNCETQDEIDFLWTKLCEGGSESRCGWLKDKYGISWQIIPTTLGALLNHPDPEKAGRAVQAMLQMTKINLDLLKKAVE